MNKAENTLLNEMLNTKKKLDALLEQTGGVRLLTIPIVENTEVVDIDH